LNWSLNDILSLVGRLDDAAGENTSRDRFREFLSSHATEAGQIRDYIEECLRSTGEQYNRALQDLINHIGRFLGFKVTFGRYQGVHGQIGFDGHWESPKGAHIVVEVKTTEAYAIRTATLANYINELVSAQKIPRPEDALGLYVIERPDPELRQLENAILAENRVSQLRIISAESLLSLSDLMDEYDVSHADVLAILKPSGPMIDPVVSLMAGLVAGQKAPNGGEVAGQKGADGGERAQPQPPAPIPVSQGAFWLTPVASNEAETADQVIQRLVAKNRIYAFSEKAPGRRNLKPGDRICFHASGKGVVADARILSGPTKEPQPVVRNSEDYPWIIKLDQVKLYLETPVIIDAALRATLHAFTNRDPNQPWGWFVVTTRKVTEHDFGIITRSQSASGEPAR
jgi:hypothetical protein